MASLQREHRKLTIPLACMTNMTVGYCTDIEGNLAYWKRFISISKVLEESEDGVVLKSNCYFVYGGDVCDRGPGDIRVMRDIINLKKRNPDHVFIILGNRDVNKMRLLTELQDDYVTEPTSTYWMGELTQTGAFTAANRLRAIFEQTMGAPGTFEYRRQELRELELDSDDDAVVRSFKESVCPEGVMLEYLRLGSLAVKLGDVLFLHGGVHEHSLGWIPPMSSAAPLLPSEIGGSWALDVDSWCNGLEAFRWEEMDEFTKYSCAVASAPPGEGLSVCGGMLWSAEGGYGHLCPGSRLIQYGMGWMPDKSVNPTLIYDNFLEDGAPQPPAAAVTHFLAQSGVAKLVVGHQPHGDAPVVISDASVQVITGDTSYATGVRWDPPSPPSSSSDIEPGRRLAEMIEGIRRAPTHHLKPSDDPADTRGVAASEILFIFRHPNEPSHTRIHGYLQNGLEYNFKLPPADTDTLIGKATEDRWWVKARMTPGNTGDDAPGLATRLCCTLPYSAAATSKGPLSDDEDIPETDDDVYLVCLSVGRDVFNSLERGRDIKSRMRKGNHLSGPVY